MLENRMLRKSRSSYWQGLAAKALCLTLFIPGCSDPNIAYVSGSARCEKGEVPEGTRIFFERPGQGYVASAIVDTKGNFQLNHQGSRKIHPGEYVVFIGPPQSMMSPAEFEALRSKVNAEYKQRGKSPPPSPDWIFPEKYYQSASSPIHETVHPGDNVIQILIE